MGQFYDISELEADIFPEEQLDRLELELKDGQVMTCEVVDVFAYEEHEYMVLHPIEDTEGVVHLMRMGAGEDDALQLYSIEDEQELQTAIEIFKELYEEKEPENPED